MKEKVTNVWIEADRDTGSDMLYIQRNLQPARAYQVNSQLRMKRSMIAVFLWARRNPLPE